MIVEEELEKDYNPEDEDIVFIRVVFSQFLDLRGNLENVRKNDQKNLFLP